MYNFGCWLPMRTVDIAKPFEKNVNYLRALCWRGEAGRESSTVNKVEIEYEPFLMLDSQITGLKN